MRVVSGAGRLGILGGTFDPIHVGHLDTARAARSALALQPILVMPARIPPHRQQGPSASTFHRFAMAALAVSDLEDVLVSDDELSADGPSYTALTLERLIGRGLQPTQIFFIAGADAFLEIETWYRYPAVLDLAHFVVISRAGVPASALGDRLPALRSRLVSASPSERLPSTPSVFLVEATTADVSSTEVRRRLRAGESVRGLVPPAVETHIQRHRLYLEPTTANHLR
jgi:nicotinate-nucleotide adenylyltransferase